MSKLSKIALLNLLTFATIFSLNQSVAANPLSDAARNERAVATNPSSDAARNERAVVAFYTKVFIERQDVSKIAKHFVVENYIQHNPYVPTGRQGFVDAISAWLPSIPSTRYVIKRVVTSGDMVILHVHSYDIASNAPGKAGVDIFRVDQDGKIIEHWDVWQDIPTWMAHENGMF